MGFVIDDPTRPQDVGEAAKKFLMMAIISIARETGAPSAVPPFPSRTTFWTGYPSQKERGTYIKFTSG